MNKIIIAPWTDEQVANLNKWQASTNVHPFTCGNRGTEKHTEALSHLMVEPAQEGILTATKDGWRCSLCDYKQYWAHDFMVNGETGVDQFKAMYAMMQRDRSGVVPTLVPSYDDLVVENEKLKAILTNVQIAHNRVSQFLDLDNYGK